MSFKKILIIFPWILLNGISDVYADRVFVLNDVGEKPIYEKIYSFGDNLMDSGNFLGLRQIPNQTPYPVGEGYYYFTEALTAKEFKFLRDTNYNPYDENLSFPTARLAQQPFNLIKRTDIFLAKHPNQEFNRDYVFIFWAGLNDVKHFINKNKFNVFQQPRIDTQNDVEAYVRSIKRISDLRGEIIVMNVPDLAIFPGGRLNPSTGNLITKTLKGLSTLFRLDFNYHLADEYLAQLHYGRGIKGLDNLIATDLADFKKTFWFIDSKLIDRYAAAFYTMQNSAVDDINQQLNAALSNNIERHNVLYADIRGMFREVLENPEFWHLDNLLRAECGPYSSAGGCKTNPRDQDNYFFGDDFNLNNKSQRIIAAYISNLINSSFVVGGLFNSLLTTNIGINNEIFNGVSIKIGNYFAKPTLDILANIQVKEKRWTYGVDFTFRSMAFRHGFMRYRLNTIQVSPYIYKPLTIYEPLADYFYYGLESQNSITYVQEAHREVTFEVLPLTYRDRLESASGTLNQKMFLAMIFGFKYDNQRISLKAKAYLGNGVSFNHLYEEKTNYSTSVRYRPNNIRYMAVGGKLNAELKNIWSKSLALGFEIGGVITQPLNNLKIKGGLKTAPVKTKKNIKLITHYDGNWGLYAKYKLSPESAVKVGYQGRFSNYKVRHGVYVDYRYFFK